MNYISLGLGIVLGHIFIRQLYVAIVIIFYGDSANNAFHLAMFSSELSIVLGVVLSVYILRKNLILERLPKTIHGEKYLKAGVYLFLFVWVIFIISRVIPHSVYLLTSFPPISFILKQGLIIYSISNLLIFYGLFLALLSAKPSNHEIS